MTTLPRPLSFALILAGMLALGAAAAVSLSARQVVVTSDVQISGAPPALPLPPGFGGNGPSSDRPLPPGTGMIAGQTVDAAGSRPLGGVVVTLTVAGAVPIRVLTDGQGRFVFRDLPKGGYVITGRRSGFTEGATGRMRPAGPTRAVTLNDGERATNVTIPLWKLATITGMVTDEAGEPAINVAVRVLRRTITSGKPKLTLGATDLTDDRGLYRIGGLEPGDYVVAIPMSQRQGPQWAAIEGLARAGGGGVGDVMFTAAAPAVSVGSSGPVALSLDMGLDAGTAGKSADGKPMVYPTAFYPNAVAASRATLIKLGSGDERAGVDFQLRPARAVKISGVVSGPEGPAQNLSLMLVPAEADGAISPIETATTGTDATGAFTFSTVPPGRYVLRALRAPMGAMTVTMSDGGGQVVMVRRVITATNGAPAPPPEATLWAEQPVNVGSDDIANIGLTLRAGLKVSGQLEFSGGGARPAPADLQNVQVSLESADASAMPAAQTVRGRVETSGQFSTSGAMPGRYFVKANGAPQGWYFKGATLNGRDVTDTPLEIESSDIGSVTLVFTDRQTEVSGSVTSASGAGDATAAVIVFPAEREAWSNYGSSPRRLRNVPTQSNGTFTLRGLPAGRYLIAAVRDAVASDWQDPQFLESLASSATTMEVSDGQKVTQTLKVVR